MVKYDIVLERVRKLNYIKEASKQTECTRNERKGYVMCIYHAQME